MTPPLLCFPLLIGLVTADPAIWTSHLAFRQPGADLLLRGIPGWADGNAGVTTEALGGLAASDWLAGRVPWWNPYSGIGLPLAAEQQNSALFLPFVLLLACHNGVLLLKISLQIATGFACFGLLRSLGFTRLIACACGLLAELNGTFAWYSHGPIMPVAFLPLLLCGLERCRISATQRRIGVGAPIVAVAVAMSLLAGFPETAYLDGLLGAVWFAARFVAVPGRVAKCRFAGHVAAGGACGLLLAAPAVVTFLASLPVSYLSGHVDFDTQHLLRPNLLMLVLPYAFGPILFNAESGGGGAEIWWHAGGFIGLVLASAASLGIISAWQGLHARDRVLRGALTIWLLATALKAIGWAPAVALFDRLPFIRQSMFYVYVLPSWEIASIVLAAYAMREAEGRRLRRSAVWIVSLVVTLYVAAAVRLSWPWLADMAQHVRLVRVAAWLPSAIELSLAVVFLGSLAMSRRGRIAWPIAALVTASIVDFAVPLLSAASPRKLDLAPVQWLRAHQGYGRFYSEYLLQPNTAAQYRLGSVNHIYLPVPRNWVDYLHRHLNPAMDGVTFFGNDLRATEVSAATLANALHPPTTIGHAISVLENLAVRYVVAPHGVDPFADTIGPKLDLRSRSATPLAGATTIIATIGSTALAGQNVTQLGLEIGTYGGRAAGVIVATLCTKASCATARFDVADAADNAIAWTNLDRALPIGAAGTVRLTIDAEGPQNRPALWQSPCTDDACRTAPVALLRFRPMAEPVLPVYADPLVDIFPLPSPSPYLSTLAGHCRLDVRSRNDVVANCSAPDTLVRRELFYPGWHVGIGKQVLPIEPAGEIFQSVRLRAGTSAVRFRYRPPGEALILSGFASGLVLLVLLGGAWIFDVRRKGQGSALDPPGPWPQAPIH